MSPDVARLVRWVEGGGHWLVLRRTPDEITVALYSCDDEEMARVRSAEPDLLAYVGDRSTSAD